MIREFYIQFSRILGPIRTTDDCNLIGWKWFFRPDWLKRKGIVIWQIFLKYLMLTNSSVVNRLSFRYSESFSSAIETVLRSIYLLKLEFWSFYLIFLSITSARPHKYTRQTVDCFNVDSKLILFSVTNAVAWLAVVQRVFTSFSMTINSTDRSACYILQDHSFIKQPIYLHVGL